MHLALRLWSAERRSIAIRLLAYIGGIAGLAVLAAEIVRSPDGAAAAPPPPRRDWVTVDKPHPAFELTLPDFAEAEPTYTIRRHALGGGRKDIIAYGEPGRTARSIMIEVYRPGTEIGSFAEATAALMARTDDFHRAGAVHTAAPLGTKFGPVALFDFTIRPEHEIGRCIGFVRTYDAPRLQITGFACDTKDFALSRETIACALDRFTLLAAGSDPKVGELFARAELNRKFCGQRNSLMAATPKRPIVANPPAVRLRGHLAGN